MVVIMTILYIIAIKIIIVNSIIEIIDTSDIIIIVILLQGILFYGCTYHSLSTI